MEILSLAKSNTMEKKKPFKSTLAREKGRYNQLGTTMELGDCLFGQERKKKNTKREGGDVVGQGWGREGEKADFLILKS